jgi:hypothetical protein
MFPVNVDGTGTTGGARVVGEGGTARVELAAIAMCQHRLQMQIRRYEEVEEVKMIRDKFRRVDERFERQDNRYKAGTIAVTEVCCS